MREELVAMPIARLLVKHQTFGRKAGLTNQTVRAVRNLDGNPYYRPRAETVRRWLEGAESPVSFDELLRKHGVTVEELESRDPMDDVLTRHRDRDRAGHDAPAQDTKVQARQTASASATVSPSFRLGAVSDATPVAVRRELSTLLIDIAAVITDYAAQLDPDVTAEHPEAETRTPPHSHETHSSPRTRVRR